MKKIDAGGYTKRFLNDQEAGELVNLVYSKLGLDLRGFINDQGARDLMRTMPVGTACKEAREKMKITIRQAATQMKIQQSRIKGAEGDPGGSVTQEALEKYVDFLGIRGWFDTWLKVNRDVYERIETEAPKRLKKMRSGK